MLSVAFQCSPELLVYGITNFKAETNLGLSLILILILILISPALNYFVDVDLMDFINPSSKRVYICMCVYICVYIYTIYVCIYLNSVCILIKWMITTESSSLPYFDR